MEKPKVSIIMGIYNCDSTLSESIDSILSQTYTNWELIMCDDGSSDNTLQVAKGYEEKYPKKIKVIQNTENKGLNYTLNHCAKYVRGEFIARQDGDDLSLPNRLEKQVKILEENSDISIVSSAMIHYDEKGEWGVSDYDIYPQAKTFPQKTPFAHAPCIIRRDAFEKVKGYSVRRNLIRVEDYHLWVKLYAAGYTGKNIKEPLYKMRDDRNATTRRRYIYRLNEAYVKLIAIKKFRLKKTNYIYVIRPLIVGLLPREVYEFWRKRKLNKKEQENEKK